MPEQPSPSSDAAAVTALSGGAARKLMLIVEDERTTRRLLERMMKLLGFDVVCVADGVECLAQFGIHHGGDVEEPRRAAPPRRRFDVVLMDGTMPRLDGVQTTRILRHAGLSQLPIVAVTANATQADQQAFLEAGAHLVVPKPISRQQICDALQSLLGPLDSQGARGGGGMPLSPALGVSPTSSSSSINLS